ncbi:MAG TPA: ABC transporter ATP-binding protein [Anaeromyxobacteraceae bacterium]|nr:ABC transporter ATP-binding protein [Anaeromyxobacteraceae bacterium]
MAEIRLVELRKEFKDVTAVDDVTMTFRSSAVTCLLGPSGCGKTTMMRIIAGLERPSSGDVFFDDERVTDVVTRRRKIGMVFQYPVVYSGITVRENVELPLLHEGLSPAERARRVDEVVDILRMREAVDTSVAQLDMATRQKVAVAREIARQPRFILFDEPITNVDVETKIQIRRALKVLTRQRKQTIIYVTHDQTDAMTLADEIVLMNRGRIVQRDAPRILYDEPADTFGGWFLGNPGMNFFEHEVARADGAVRIVSPLFAAPVLARGAALEERVVVGIRPEHVEVKAEHTARAVKARIVRKTIGIGGQYLLAAQIDGKVMKVKVRPEVGARVGCEAWLECPLDRVRIFGSDGRRREVSLTDAPA